MLNTDWIAKKQLDVNSINDLKSRLSRTLTSCNLTKRLNSITWQVLTLLLQKVISYESLAVQTLCGAKQSSVNYEVLQNA